MGLPGLNLHLFARDWVGTPPILLLVLYFFAAPQIRSSAQVLSVFVTDTLDTPLSSSYVAVLNASGERVLLGGFTDVEGRLSLTLPDKIPAVLLGVEHLGYEPESRAVRLDSLAPGTEYHFRLRERPQRLSDAVVRAKRRAPPVSNNDTTTLDLATFRDSTERNLQELLARAPDVQVLADGNLEYRGQRISRILVDGKDIFGGGQYAEPLRRLRPDIVAKVDAIERYHEDAVLARLEPSRETVLDITTAAESRGTADGQLDTQIGVDTETRFRYANEFGLVGLDRSRAYYLDATTSRLADPVTLWSEGTEGRAPAGGRQEPIGTPFATPLGPNGAYRAAGLGAPPALTQDAAILGATAKAFFRGEAGASTRLEVRGLRGADALALAETTSAQTPDVNYRLRTDAQTRIRSGGVAVQADHYAATPAGNTTWRLLADARFYDERSAAVTSLLNEGTRREDYRHDDRATDHPAYLAARLNQAVGTAGALQFYGSLDVGVLDDQLTVDLDTGLAAIVLAKAAPQGPSPAPVPPSASRTLSQNLRYDYRVWRGGATYLQRLGFANLRLFGEGTLQRFETRLLLDAPPVETHGSRREQRYGVAGLGGCLTFPFGSRWQGVARMEMLGVADLSETASAATPGYQLEGRYIINGRPVYTVFARREVRLPYLAPAPGLSTVGGSFALAEGLAQVVPSFDEAVGGSLARSFSKLNLDSRLALRYTYRSAEVLGAYDLTEITTRANPAGQRRRSSVRVDAYFNQVSLRLRTVSTLRLRGAYVTRESNLVGGTGTAQEWRVGFTYEATLPGYVGVVPVVRLRHDRQHVGGAVTARNTTTDARLQLRYWHRRLRFDGAFGQAWASAGDIRTRAYRYGEAGMSYGLSDAPTSVTLGLRGYNLLFERRARVVRYAQPFTTDQRVEASPPTLVVEVVVPLRAKL